MAGTITRADMGLGATRTAPAPALQGLSGRDQGSVAPPGSAGVAPTQAPAFAWAVLVGGLALLRWMYERGR